MIKQEMSWPKRGCLPQEETLPLLTAIYNFYNKRKLLKVKPAVTTCVQFIICIRGLFKKYREFWISAGYVIRFSIFCGVMLVLIFFTYVDKFGYFERSVDFYSYFALTCFGSSSIFAFSKKGILRICIKFCVKNKIKWVDAFRMLTVAYGEATLNQSNDSRWYKMFSEGQEDVNDEQQLKTLMKWRE